MSRGYEGQPRPNIRTIGAQATTDGVEWQPPCMTDSTAMQRATREGRTRRDRRSARWRWDRARAARRRPSGRPSSATSCPASARPSSDPDHRDPRPAVIAWALPAMGSERHVLAGLLVASSCRTTSALAPRRSGAPAGIPAVVVVLDPASRRCSSLRSTPERGCRRSSSSRRRPRWRAVAFGVRRGSCGLAVGIRRADRGRHRAPPAGRGGDRRGRPT